MGRNQRKSFSSFDDLADAKGIEKQAKELDQNSNIVSFIYPFNFISLGNKIEKAERELGKNSGKLECSLINYTPIFTGGEKSKSGKHTTEQFLEDKDNYIISASTLKGEIRNIIETITHSCIRCKKGQKIMPEEFKPCDDIKKLCFACRLFGTTVEKADDKGKSAYSGRVYFSDAKLPKIGNPTTETALKPTMSPNEKLKKYYLDKYGRMRGRKFYWHHVNLLSSKNNKSPYKEDKKTSQTTVHLLKPLKRFSFKVEFKNLTDIELGMLIYALELEKNLLHKIGRGKALGLGSCKINIDSFELFEENRYNFSSFTPNKKIKKVEDKNIYLEKIKNKYFKNNSQLEQLRVILNEKNNLDFSEGAYIKRESNKGNMPEILSYK